MSNERGAPTAFGAQMPQSPQESYGFQVSEVWRAGDTDWRPLLDVVPNGELWRVAVAGEDLEIELEWGTSKRRKVTLHAPAAADLPGYVAVRARPLGQDGARGLVTLTRSSGGGPQCLRLFTSTVGALPDDAASFTAIGAGTAITVGGVAVAVAVGQTIPLVSGSTLTAGSGVLEFIP